ncbi:Uncharacterized conserved protein YgbK, DUF1537 family [Rhizobium sp. RU20A]|uniref:four-carbon acid sugar kinase family protein n=1 Tax=Rhizobium sp. RU20A TaxID=1907412 RepID=UPI0009573D12|nr:four-carbon acid sugar kinase family protein [Rhizobium sp. RU20A]SIR38041.1 Uncharacterized conserved protein YgbK, DUF1537 family [Rhizobium sp. RU20A]
MLVIVADDLTGALDTAAPFAARGLHTEVVLKADAVAQAVSLSPDVLSINLASREGSPEAAFEAMRTLVGRLPPQVRMFKKVDSRLKGHIASELDAVSYGRALVAPAIPAFGRVVRNAHVDGFGVAEPLSIAGVLKHHADRSIIPDTATEDEIHAALERAERDGADLLVGARGLAEVLARKMTGKTVGGLVAPPAGPGLFVIGSRDGITLAQVEQLRQSGTVAYRPAPNGVMAEGPMPPAAVRLVQATEGASTLSSEAVSANLADSVHPRLTAEARTLLLCGGATAEAVLAKMGITCFRLEGECLPGLGLAYADGQCIIAKSGGFGGPETLATLAGKLHGGRG